MFGGENPPENPEQKQEGESSCSKETDAIILWAMQQKIEDDPRITSADRKAFYDAISKEDINRARVESILDKIPERDLPRYQDAINELFPTAEDAEPTYRRSDQHEAYETPSSDNKESLLNQIKEDHRMERILKGIILGLQDRRVTGQSMNSERMKLTTTLVEELADISREDFSMRGEMFINSTISGKDERAADEARGRYRTALNELTNILYGTKE